MSREVWSALRRRPPALAATLLTLLLLARPGGMRRTGGVALLGLYFAFVGGTLVGS